MGPENDAKILPWEPDANGRNRPLKLCGPICEGAATVSIGFLWTPVVRKNSITQASARLNIRGAGRRGSVWHARCAIPRIGSGSAPFVGHDVPSADRAHLAPGPYVDGRCCNEGPKNAGS